MGRQLKLALIGVGRRGRGRLRVYSRLREVFDFIAVCDKDENALAEVAREHGVRTYASVRDLVEKEQIDVADVVVPGDAHHVICHHLTSAGVNIIVETPLAPTRPMCDLIIESARRNKVKLEVAENYHRTPLSRFQMAVISSGLIGEVSRIYRIFYEGGYHGMSMLRLLAGSQPRSILGITHSSPVVPITDLMNRHHAQENLQLSYLEFQNGVAAIMAYSNVIHARSLGRRAAGIWQIDGTKGTILEDGIYYTPPGDYERGARATPYKPEYVATEVNGAQVLERIVLKLPDRTVSWENPYTRLGVGEMSGGFGRAHDSVDVTDELMSIANALLYDKEPTYGVQQARLDVEMDLAARESALRSKVPLEFPLQHPSQVESEIHERFRTEYGCDFDKVDQLIDVWFPRR
jgi:predicted dehydrogenase